MKPMPLNESQLWLVRKMLSLGFPMTKIAFLLKINQVYQNIANQCDTAEEMFGPVPKGVEAIYQAQLHCLVELFVKPERDENELKLIEVLSENLGLKSLKLFLEGVMLTMYWQSHLYIPTSQRPFGNLIEAIFDSTLMHTPERLSAFLQHDSICAFIMNYAQSLVRCKEIPKDETELRSSLAKYAIQYFYSTNVVRGRQWDDGLSSGKIAVYCRVALDSKEKDALIFLFGLNKNSQPMLKDELTKTFNCSLEQLNEIKDLALEKLRSNDFLEQVLICPQ